ncbi:MAG TPA: hypothetical protein VEA69_05550 [Tepidisphaeraceae bacterium]|nr:hypothetical protein [Tepidisphaeraceae bacterium]
MSELKAAAPNTPYYGDNLDILRRYAADESVDLIYSGLPFNPGAEDDGVPAEKDGTQPMLAEAADAGFFTTKSIAGTKHPRLQILTIEDLLAGRRIDVPAAQDIRSFKQAPKAKGRKADQPGLF